MEDLERRMDGPYSDIKTRNLVLQLLSENPIASGDGALRSYGPSYLWRPQSSNKGESKNIFDDEGIAQTGLLETFLSDPESIFKYSFESLKVKAEEEARMRAYRGITVSSTVLHGEDDEIEKNPP